MTSNTLFFLLFFPTLIFSQVTISQDFDGDRIADKVDIEDEIGTVIYQLSTQKFKKIKTDEFVDSGTLSLQSKKNGFELSVLQMRAGNSYQFRYEKETKKMRLIGMRRTEYGPANNDGSGESSVNLLTNNYLGNWNYFDEKKSALIKIPTIKKKMILPKAYFNDLKNVFSIYMDKDVQFYLAEKKKLYSK